MYVNIPRRWSFAALNCAALRRSLLAFCAWRHVLVVPVIAL